MTLALKMMARLYNRVHGRECYHGFGVEPAAGQWFSFQADAAHWCYLPENVPAVLRCPPPETQATVLITITRVSLAFDFTTRKGKKFHV